MSPGTVSPPADSGSATHVEADRFKVTAGERDTLVRHARFVIFESGDQMTHSDEETIRRASQHVAVMVRLLDQLGWSEERAHDGTYLLSEKLLPIEQIRVWVDSRFRVTDEEAINDSVRGHGDDLEHALRRHGETMRLLHRLNLRAEVLRGDRLPAVADDAAAAARRVG